MSYCKFHPLADAKYSCSECEIICCAECSQEPTSQHFEDSSHRCFVCGTPMQSLAKESNIEPFWRVLNNIYRYPTSASALAVIFISALLTSVFPIWFVWFFTSIAVIHYCFACLRHTAQGNLDAPDFNESFEGSISPIFYVFLLFIIVGILGGFLASFFGLGFGVLAWIVFVIALPASILLIAIEEKLSPALNPSRLFGIISATGTSYFVMMLFVLIMSSSVGLLNSLFASESMTSLGMFIQTAISNYYSIVIFHIMGYMVYQNGPQLGYFDKKNLNTESSRSDDKVLNAKIEVLIKSGSYQEAIELCVKQVKSDKANFWQWQRCFKLLLTSESAKRLEAFSHAYLKKLDELDQSESMAEAYMTVKRKLPDFEVKTPALQLKIGDELLQIGKYKYVVLLLRKLHTITKDKKPLAESFNLLSQAYARIPGEEKKSLLYKQQHQRILGPT